MKSRRRVATLMTVVAVTAGGLLATSAPANARLSTMSRFAFEIDHHELEIIEVEGTFIKPAEVAHLVVDAESGGVDLAAGTATATDAGDDQTEDVPVDSVGSLDNGEQATATATDIDTDQNGVPVSITTLTEIVTCHLDASGTGTCS